MAPGVSISVITAALNAEKTIQNCLESLKNQNYPAQHMIVDGGSTDGTLEIAKKHASPSAIIVSEADRGPYDAINKGLALVTGEVIGTLNADDFYPHHRVLSMVARVFEDPEVEACYGDLVYVDRYDLSRIVRYWKSKAFKRRFFYNGWMPAHPTFFVRRSVYESLGTFNLDQGSAADYELMLRFLLKHGVRALYIPTLLVVMRTGGLSDRGLRQRVRANRMDRRAWTVNGLRPMPWTLIAKPIRKIFQFFYGEPRGCPWLEDEWPSGSDGQTREENGYTAASTSAASQSHPQASRDIPFYVVTVNYGADASLRRLIESLEPIDFLKKLVIVNHSESADLHDLRSRIPMEMISQPNIGYGGGLNSGLRKIRELEAIALLCNPDTAILDTGELLNAVTYLKENPGIGCLVPRLVDEESKQAPCWRNFYSIESLVAARVNVMQEWRPSYLRIGNVSHEAGAKPVPVDWGSGSALLFKTSLFPYPVSFDERFFLYFEDVDFCAQIWKAGSAVQFYPGLTLLHKGRMASHRSLYFLGLHISSLVKFVLKYRGLPQRADLIRRVDRTAV